MKNEEPSGWYYVGIGVMIFLIAIGIGGCLRIADGKGQLIVIQTK